jgi:hypothetical protein
MFPLSRIETKRTWVAEPSGSRWSISAQGEAGPRHLHRPGFDAAEAVEALLERRDLEQVVEAEGARRLDQAGDLDRPRLGERVAAGQLPDAALVGGELVEVVVAGGGLLGGQVPAAEVVGVAALRREEIGEALAERRVELAALGRLTPGRGAAARLGAAGRPRQRDAQRPEPERGDHLAAAEEGRLGRGQTLADLPRAGDVDRGHRGPPQ